MLHYQGNGFYNYHSDSGRVLNLSLEEINGLINEVSEEIEKDYDSHFKIPQNRELISDIENIEYELETTRDTLKELRKICDSFIKEVEETL